jgi:hypothetical protein
MQEAGVSTRGGSPRVLIYMTALACGLFLALAVHIALTAAGVGLTGASPELFFSSKNQLNLALAWWAIGLAGCFGSLAAIILTRRLNRPRLRRLRVILAFAYVPPPPGGRRKQKPE